jgi:O-antigen/teichoic acid export membrane protein
MADTDPNPDAPIEIFIPNQRDKDILTVAKGGSTVFIGKVSQRVIAYAYSAALIWGIGAVNFGLFTLTQTIILFVGVISSLGLNLGIVRFGAIQAQNEERYSIHRATMIALRISLPFGFILLLILIWGADFIAGNIFNKPELAPLLRVLGFSVPFMVVQFLLLAATRALKIMKYSVSVWIIQPLTALLLAILLMVLGLGIQAVVFAFVVSYVIGSGLALKFYLNAVPRKGQTEEEFPWRQMIKFSLPLSFVKWIEFANQRTEIIFLGLIPGAIDVGIYKIAWSLAGLETIFRESLEWILAPFSSDLSYRKEIKQLEVLYKTTAKWSLTGGLMFFLMFALFSETIMSVFDPIYVTGAQTLVLLGFAQLINASTGPCGTVLIMSGRSDLSLLNTIVLFTVSITLDWSLIPRFGLTGAAWAGAIAVILVIILRVVEVWWTLKIHPFKWSMLKPLFAGLISFALIFLLQAVLNSGGLAVDMVYGLIFCVVYISIIYLLKLDADELLVLKAMRHRITGFIVDLRNSRSGVSSL